MLTQYQNLTQQLLQNPQATTALYSLANITSWVNIARGQLAGEGECIRVEGTLTTTVGQRNYNFSAINLGTPSSTGVQGAIHVNRIAYATMSGGRQWLTPRPWPYFDFYYLSNPIPVNNPPARWAQYGQGSAGQGNITGIGAGTMSSGNFYLDPPPDQSYLLYLDCTCYPIALSQDTDPEAIPYLWTDAVPFYACWYALISAQTSIRMEEANDYKKIYDDMVRRARQAANSSTLRSNYEQSVDQAAILKVGMGNTGGAQKQGGG